MKTFLFFFIIGSNIIAQKIDTLTIFSESMQKNIKNVVIIPTPDTANEKKFPVIYLLHGAYGDYTNWISKVPEIKNYANQYQIIIVCPDGDPFSWYLDAPADKNYKYETYLTKELINKVDLLYKTINAKNSRAITGLSMGGHGAFYLALKHQNLFGAAGSMSGVMDLTINADKKNYELNKRLGTYTEYPDNWTNNSVINLADLATGKELKLYFDCGIEDPFYETNRNLHRKMLELKIPHYYTERPGKHNWSYWAESIKYHLVFFNDFFSNRK